MTIHEYVEQYEFRSDECDHVPTDSEKAMLEDAIEGYIASIQEMAARIGAEFVPDPAKIDAFKEAHS